MSVDVSPPGHWVHASTVVLPSGDERPTPQGVHALLVLEYVPTGHGSQVVCRGLDVSPA